MVTPPTLKAAKPVGAVMAHVMSLDGHSSHSKALIVSIRNDLPVPPTPLTNILSGL